VTAFVDGGGQTETTLIVQRGNLRVFPAFVVDSVLETTLLIVAFHGFHFEHLGLVQKLMMKAEGLLVLSVHGLWCWSRRHVCSRMQKLLVVDGVGVKRQEQRRSARVTYPVLLMPKDADATTPYDAMMVSINPES